MSRTARKYNRLITLGLVETAAGACSAAGARRSLQLAFGALHRRRR